MAVRNRQRVGSIEAELTPQGWAWEHGGAVWRYKANGLLTWDCGGRERLAAFVQCLKVAVGFSVGWVSSIENSRSIQEQAAIAREQEEPKDQVP